MAWSATWPDGTQSVKTNQATGAANTTYTKTTMNVDHYWDSSANNDGHHQWVQMTQSGTVAVPVDVPLATGMEGAIYLKAKLAAEAVDNQDVQPFFVDNKVAGTPGTEQIMQLLGVRAMGVFDKKTTNGAITLQYSHNCTAKRTGTGLYVVEFTNPLPSNNYLLLGGCVRNATASSDVGFFAPSGSTTLAKKTTASCEFRTYSFSGSPASIDPTQTWFVIFGG